jgi:hypothetical protein
MGYRFLGIPFHDLEGAIRSMNRYVSQRVLRKQQKGILNKELFVAAQPEGATRHFERIGGFNGRKRLSSSCIGQKQYERKAQT